MGTSADGVVNTVGRAVGVPVSALGASGVLTIGVADGFRINSGRTDATGLSGTSLVLSGRTFDCIDALGINGDTPVPSFSTDGFRVVSVLVSGGRSPGFGMGKNTRFNSDFMLTAGSSAIATPRSDSKTSSLACRSLVTCARVGLRRCCCVMKMS